MRSLLVCASFVLTPFILTQCVVVDDRTADSSSTTSVSDSSLRGYPLGLKKGREDGEGGESRTPERYNYLYSEADRQEYFRGYEDGYNQGIR